MRVTPLADSDTLRYQTQHLLSLQEEKSSDNWYCILFRFIDVFDILTIKVKNRTSKNGYYTVFFPLVKSFWLHFCSCRMIKWQFDFFPFFFRWFSLRWTDEPLKEYLLFLIYKNVSAYLKSCYIYSTCPSYSIYIPWTLPSWKSMTKSFPPKNLNLCNW